MLFLSFPFAHCLECCLPFYSMLVLQRLLDALPYHLLLCGHCTYYCSVKLVAVIGDSGLCQFYLWVWSQGGLMFYSNCHCRKGSFCHRSTLVWCDVKAMVCCSCPCHCYLCPSFSPTPTSFSLILPPSPPTSVSLSPLSPHSLTFSLSLSLSLSLYLL